MFLMPSAWRAHIAQWTVGGCVGYVATHVYHALLYDRYGCVGCWRMRTYRQHSILVEFLSCVAQENQPPSRHAGMSR